jgi:hypothetical protein
MLGVFFNYTGKFLLTAFAAGLFLFLLGAILRIQAAFHASQTQLSHTALHIGTPSPGTSHNSSVQSLWPEYPRSSGRNIQNTVINGVEILTEEWETDASAADVLAYYREQMAARGWQDTTEQTYGLQRDPHEVATIEGGPQAQQYAGNYQRIKDSTLVMSRQSWSLHLSAEPSQKRTGTTAVQFYAASTPSIQDFGQELAAAFAPKAGQTRRPMDAVQHDAGQTYHTTIVLKDESPARAFDETLATLASKRWQRVAVPPKPGARPGHFAWLVRGGQYAVLSVTASPHGAGSSVFFMEVSPDARK